MATEFDKFMQDKKSVFLTYTGMETDLIFTQGIDLPGFASFPLLKTDEGRAVLKRYYRDLIAFGQKNGVGVVLESTTWVANRDRAAAIGYTPEQLCELNIDAMALLEEMRDEAADHPVVLSANVGPRRDAYLSDNQMTAVEAEIYHAAQMKWLAATSADLISGYTISYPAEAVGIVRAAKLYNLPVIIAFTLEIDGRLPSGTSLEQAIGDVDDATDSYASYFMINCAHPDHFNAVLRNAPWEARLGGIVANASRCSHAELDNAKVLDAGDPVELGRLMAGIRRRHPHIRVLGGCCGTDMRHLREIVRQIDVG